MSWKRIWNESGPGETWVADVGTGVVMRTIREGRESMVFVPGVSGAGLVDMKAPPVPQTEKVDPAQLPGDEKQIWDRVLSADPEVLGISRRHFKILVKAVKAARQG